MSAMAMRAPSRSAGSMAWFGVASTRNAGLKPEIGRPSVLYAVATGSRERVESVEVGGVALIVAEGVFRIAQS